MKSKFDRQIAASLDSLLTPVERARVLARCRDKRGCLFVITAVTAVMLMVLILAFLAKPYLSYVENRVLFFVSTFVAAVIGVSAREWHERRKGRRIMEYLKEIRVRPHLCLNCEYDLRGSTADHCPECGTALALEDGAAV
ncbi:hypothetical protein OT109_09925 [Phycisphaeraceae bacterium D3-23]